MGNVTKDTLLDLYVLKIIQEKIGTFLERTKQQLSAVKPEYADLFKLSDVDFSRNKNLEYKDENGLVVKFTVTSGKKTFDPKKAREILVGIAGEEAVKERFGSYTIHKKVPVIPVDVLETLNNYFSVEFHEEITEDAAKKTLVAEDLAKCYNKSDDSLRMTTPTKISEKELLSIYGERSIYPLLKED